MPRSWEELLGQLEDCVDGYREALYTGSDLPAAPLLPASLGALPPELSDRARKVLEDVRRVEVRAAELRDGIGRLIVLAEQDPPPAGSAYVDTTA